MEPHNTCGIDPETFSGASVNQPRDILGFAFHATAPSRYRVEHDVTFAAKDVRRAQTCRTS